MESFNLRLSKLIKSKRSHLCVGLDMNPEGIGSSNANLDELKKHAFKVVDSTIDLASAFKPNLAFFERWGSQGFKWLEELMDYFSDDVIIIGDAKRGDIGNTAKQYAYSLFTHFNFDAVTLSPYMGKDSITPFIENPEKGAFIVHLDNLTRPAFISAVIFPISASAFFKSSSPVEFNSSNLVSIENLA